MEPEHEVSRDFDAYTNNYFAEKIEYTSVHVLLLYWKENDLDDIATEIAALRMLFENEFNFEVTSFPIPVDGTQQQRLNTEVSAFVSQWSNAPRSLIIIYYAGHCDAGPHGEARWTAIAETGATLEWSKTQQLLFHAIGDVLLILDCCNAALVSKGAKEQGRFEMLAASAKGVKTPEPGKRSFTNLLIMELRNHLGTGVTARDLGGILRENKLITETPIWGDLVRTSPISITLKPLQLPRHDGFIKKPSAFLVFRVSLTDDVTGLQIADWLKTAPPKNVTAVNIEALVLKARRLQNRIDSNAFPPGSIFRKLSTLAQEEILRQLRGLNTVMSTSSSYAQNDLMRSDAKTVVQAYDAISSTVSAVCSAVETPILLDLSMDDLNKAERDEGALAADAAEAISLRQQIQITAITESLELPREKVKVSNSNARFRFGQIEGRSILVESYAYNPDPRTAGPYPESVRQLQRMTALLCHPKRMSFHILPCVGYIHDAFKHKFGLVFEPPPHHEREGGPKMLVELYKTERLVPLGHRIRLAYALTVAVENFHRVGWVHKEIRSDNTIFFPTEEPLTSFSDVNDSASARLGSVDLASPWLFGFEYARPQDAGTKLEEDYLYENNLYRHPNRWGRPNFRFTKAHDMYSLGIVLLEVALWKEVKYIASSTQSQRIVAENVRATLVEKCRKNLPHQVGEIFAETILACFGFEKATELKNEYETQKYFQESIMDRLRNAVGHI